MSQPETNRPGLIALGDAYLLVGDSRAQVPPEDDWNSLVIESNRLLKIVARHTRPVVVDIAAHSIAKIIRASSDLGVLSATRKSAILQSEKARAGKQIKTDRRWRSIRCAIVWVCRKQKLKMTSSDSFAESIKKDVLEAAKRFGHDLTKGTSTRSIERHIAALLKDHRLLSAILEECELQGWL